MPMHVPTLCNFLNLAEFLAFESPRICYHSNYICTSPITLYQIFWFWKHGPLSELHSTWNFTYIGPKKWGMVFCFQICSYLRWAKIVPGIEKKTVQGWRPRILRPLEQFIQTVKGQYDFETECFFSLFLYVSYVWYTLEQFKLGKNNWNSETYRKS